MVQEIRNHYFIAVNWKMLNVKRRRLSHSNYYVKRRKTVKENERKQLYFA